MFQPRLRIVTVGDEQVGKTWLVHMLCDKEIPHEYTPTTYENFCIDKIICGQMVTFSLRDTAGRPSVDEFRSICFNNADVFLLCYAADNRESFVNLQTKWIPYSKSKVESAKLILVETKVDNLFPEIFKKETRSTNDENGDYKKDGNNVPRLNLNSKIVDSNIRTKNLKSDCKSHPKISIPKSSRNPRKHFALDALSFNSRSNSPPKLINAYLDPTTRSLASLSNERSPISTRKRYYQHPIFEEISNQIEIGFKNLEDSPNRIRSKINCSASYEAHLQNKNLSNIQTKSSNLDEYTNQTSEKPRDSKFSAIEIIKLPEISEIDQIISDEEIKNLCIEEDISGFIRCSSKAGFQSKSILELAIKICALKKKWTPPFRRRMAKV